MSDSVTRTKPYVPKRQHIVTDERREHRQSPASPEGGSPEASPGGGWKRSDERANRHLPGGAFAVRAASMQAANETEGVRHMRQTHFTGTRRWARPVQQVHSSHLRSALGGFTYR